MQGPTTPPGTISPRAWALLALAVTALCCAGVAALNAAVDPTAQLGTGVLEPVAAGPRDRVAKVELLARDPLPPLVVLGSSRTKKLDPAWLSSEGGVNAAVVGGDLFEARVIAAWIADRAARTDQPMPRLVVGVDVEQFRDSSLQGSGFLDVPALADVARREAAGSDGSVGDELDRLERLLLTWQVTKASVASVRARLRGGDADPADGARRTEAGFTETGVPRADAQWQDPTAAARFARRTPDAVERTVAELRATYDANGATLDADAVDDLRALVETVDEAGGPPLLLYVTPAHPRLVDALGARGRDERHRLVVELLRELLPDRQVVDCSDCVDDASTSWIDATHPSPLGARQLAERLDRVLEAT